MREQTEPNVQEAAKFYLEAFKDGAAIVYDLSADRYLRVELQDNSRVVAMSANRLLVLLDDV